jgi:hypothetical protein
VPVTKQHSTAAAHIIYVLLFTMLYASTEKRHVVVDATWVLQCATSGVRSFPRPGQIRALSAAVAAELGTVQDQWGDSWQDPTDIDSLCEVSLCCVRVLIICFISYQI